MYKYLEDLINLKFKDRFVTNPLKRRAAKLVYLKRALSIFESSHDLTADDLKQEDNSKTDLEVINSPLKKTNAASNNKKSTAFSVGKMKSKTRELQLAYIAKQMTIDKTKMAKLVETAQYVSSHRTSNSTIKIKKPYKIHSRDSSLQSDLRAATDTTKEHTIERISTHKGSRDMIKIEDAKVRTDRSSSRRRDYLEQPKNPSSFRIARNHSHRRVNTTNGEEGLPSRQILYSPLTQRVHPILREAAATVC